jgi:hypothetical protein
MTLSITGIHLRRIAMPIDFEKTYTVELSGRQLMAVMEVAMLELQKLKGNGNGWYPMNDDDEQILGEAVRAISVPYDSMIEPAMQYAIVDGQVVWGN